jgi:hypothetical protein
LKDLDEKEEDLDEKEEEDLDEKEKEEEMVKAVESDGE